MRVIITLNEDWSPFNTGVAETLLDRGFDLGLFSAMGRMRMTVEVPEWVDFLRVLWHVWAEFSRVSDYGRFFRMRYEVSVEIDDKVYSVGVRMTPNGLVYGSIAL
jgi:hypothetical protein